MGKFSSIVKGTRATKAIEIPAPVDAAASGEPRQCLLRPLNGVEEGMALERARADAVKGGVAKPSVGEPEYDLALMVHTIALGCVDPDAPTELYFDGGADQIRASFGREAIALLYAQHEHWQDECAPTIKKLDPASWIAGVNTLGGPDEEAARDFFSSLRPGLQWIYVRSLALTHVNSPSPNSLSGSSSETGGTSEKSESASRKSKPKPNASSRKRH